MDYPDAITEGLRRRTDLARDGIIRRTRADITRKQLQARQPEQALTRLSEQPER